MVKLIQVSGEHLVFQMCQFILNFDQTFQIMFDQGFHECGQKKTKPCMTAVERLRQAVQDLGNVIAFFQKDELPVCQQIAETSVFFMDFRGWERESTA